MKFQNVEFFEFFVTFLTCRLLTTVAWKALRCTVTLVKMYKKTKKNPRDETLMHDKQTICGYAIVSKSIIYLNYSYQHHLHVYTLNKMPIVAFCRDGLSNCCVLVTWFLPGHMNARRTWVGFDRPRASCFLILIKLMICVSMSSTLRGIMIGRNRGCCGCSNASWYTSFYWLVVVTSKIAIPGLF